jgi:hypothetical protein
MAAERPDGFEEELVVRLGARAGSVGGSAPLAALREAGRRRGRRRTALRGTAAVLVLAAGVAVLSQLGGGGHGPELRPPAGEAGPGPGLSAWNEAGPVLGCAGPTSLRTPGLHQHPTSPPSAPPTGRPSSGFPTAGSPSSGFPTSVLPSTGSPTAGPSSSGPSSSGPSSSGSPSPLSADQLSRLDLARAGEAVDKVASAGYRDHYFGSCRDSATDTLYVMRVPGSGLDAAAAAAVAAWPSVKLRFSDAVASRDELQALASRIQGDRAYWESEGVEVRFVSVGGDGAGVVVDTPQWESAEARIKARYGPLVAEVR